MEISVGSLKNKAMNIRDLFECKSCGVLVEEENLENGECTECSGDLEIFDYYTYDESKKEDEHNYSD